MKDDEDRELSMEELELVVGGQSFESLSKFRCNVINSLNTKKTKWTPLRGDLVLYRGNDQIYQVVEVLPNMYGWSEILVHGTPWGLQTLSTLNCEPVEHSSKNDYDNNTTSKGD